MLFIKKNAAPTKTKCPYSQRLIILKDKYLTNITV